MAHPVDIFVGKKLRLRRKLLGLSQEAVANAVGVTFQQVQKYERGVNRISASRMAEFAEAMHVPVTYFFEGLNESDSYESTTQPVAGLAENALNYEVDVFSSPETIELLKFFYRCPPQVRKQFTEMVKAMANNQATLAS